MSFETLKKEELLQVAADYGVDVDADSTKKDIVAALAEDGVTWEAYKAGQTDEVEEVPHDEPAPAAKEEDDEDLVLVRMTRPNRTFEALGYRFTSANPFALVKESAADTLVEDIGGFRVATPREAKEYYS